MLPWCKFKPISSPKQVYVCLEVSLWSLLMRAIQTRAYVYLLPASIEKFGSAKWRVLVAQRHLRTCGGTGTTVLLLPLGIRCLESTSGFSSGTGFFDKYSHWIFEFWNQNRGKVSSPFPCSEQGSLGDLTRLHSALFILILKTSKDGSTSATPCSKCSSLQTSQWSLLNLLYFSCTFMCEKSPKTGCSI